MCSSSYRNKWQRGVNWFPLLYVCYRLMPNVLQSIGHCFPFCHYIQHTHTLTPIAFCVMPTIVLCALELFNIYITYERLVFVFLSCIQRFFTSIPFYWWKHFLLITCNKFTGKVATSKQQQQKTAYVSNNIVQIMIHVCRVFKTKIHPYIWSIHTTKTNIESKQPLVFSYYKYILCIIRLHRTAQNKLFCECMDNIRRWDVTESMCFSEDNPQNWKSFI